MIKKQAYIYFFASYFEKKTSNTWFGHFSIKICIPDINRPNFDIFPIVILFSNALLTFSDDAQLMLMDAQLMLLDAQLMCVSVRIKLTQSSWAGVGTELGNMMSVTVFCMAMAEKTKNQSSFLGPSIAEILALSPSVVNNAIKNLVKLEGGGVLYSL